MATCSPVRCRVYAHGHMAPVVPTPGATGLELGAARAAAHRTVGFPASRASLLPVRVAARRPAARRARLYGGAYPDLLRQAGSPLSSKPRSRCTRRFSGAAIPTVTGAAVGALPKSVVLAVFGGRDRVRGA